MNLAKKILKGDSEGQRIIQQMVDEIVSELKNQEYEDAIGDDYDDDDDDDLDNIDLSDLGL
jgi:hypothetical protein